MSEDKEETWSCGVCTLLNGVRWPTCKACRSPRPSVGRADQGSGSKRVLKPTARQRAPGSSSGLGPGPASKKPKHSHLQPSPSSKASSSSSSSPSSSSSLSSSSLSSASPPASTASQASSSASSSSSPPAKEWGCVACTFLNLPSASACRLCLTPRPSSSSSSLFATAHDNISSSGNDNNNHAFKVPNWFSAFAPMMTESHAAPKYTSFSSSSSSSSSSRSSSSSSSRSSSSLLISSALSLPTLAGLNDFLLCEIASFLSLRGVMLLLTLNKGIHKVISSNPSAWPVLFNPKPSMPYEVVCSLLRRPVFQQIDLKTISAVADDNMLTQIAASAEKKKEGCPGSLEFLCLENCKKVTDKSMLAIGFSGVLRNVRNLQLNKCSITDMTLSVLPSCPLLEQLDLRETKITDEGLVHLESLSRLHILKMAWCQEVTSEGLYNLSELPLQSLNLGMIPGVTDKAMDALKKCPLQRLNLGGCDVSDAGVKQLARHFQQTLSVLSLAGCKRLTDAAAASLVALPLESLHMYLCERLTDQSMRSFAALPSLQILVLSRCGKLTDQGVQELAKAKHSCLRTLELAWCQLLSDDCAAWLAQLPRLASLDLSGCKKLTKDFLTPFQHDCPQLSKLNLSFCGQGIDQQSLDQLRAQRPGLIIVKKS
eukprot:g51965.t1